MIKKLPGLIWVAFLVAVAVKKFAPPDTLDRAIAQLKGKVADATPPTPPAATPILPDGAEVHTPLPVA